MANNNSVFGLIRNSSVGIVDRITVLLDGIQFYSPWVLFGVFVIVIAVYTIMSAEAARKAKDPIQLGPGGKPLPPSPRQAREEHERILRTTQVELSHSRRAIFFCLTIALIATFLANGIIIIIHSLYRQDGWWCEKATGIYICGSAFFYCVVLLSLIDLTPSPSIAHQTTWVVSAIVELIIFSLSLSQYNLPRKETNKFLVGNQLVLRLPTDWKIIDIILHGARFILLMSLILFYALFSLERVIKAKNSSSKTEEFVPLLGDDSTNGTQISDESDTATQSENNEGIAVNKHDQEEPAFYKKTKIPKRTWWEYCKGYAIFFPYVWPYKSFRLKMIVGACLILLLCQRIVNIAVPLQLGIVTDHLTHKKNENSFVMPWASMTLFIFYKSLQGGSGLLELARNILWIPVSQYSYEALTTASFEHVHSLSLEFHLSKRTGEVISALNKGAAINTFLESATFHMFPMAFDLIAGILYFGLAFDAYYSLIVGILTFTYIYTTIRMANWRSDQRREMNNQSREAEALKNDSLMSYETVKYFNAEEFEFKRFRQSILDFQNTQYEVELSFCMMYISQNMIFLTGLFLISFISAYQVTSGTRDVGDFVTLLTFMTQLQSPLSYFGTFYRGIQSAMINSERLLELFKEQPSVVDKPGVVNLKVCKGHIRFDNVKFSYDKRQPTIQGLNFTCPPGSMTALVGESGGGKSTVFKLLFRFYNIDEGSIQIDGHNVIDLSMTSVRDHISIVPQETILFNETVMYNLKYAKQSATDEEIFAACRAASIHEKILSFPDGYNSMVGERGLRLSGGEKQRVAIARAILKNPRIVLLDEATAALDSHTEQNIQQALQNLTVGRTLFVIAHRLSTIACADQILVLHSGKIVETGTHDQLLARKGRYYDMWKRQIQTDLSPEHLEFAMVQAQSQNWVASMKRQDGSSCQEENLSESTLETEAADKRFGSSSVDLFNETKLSVPTVMHTTEIVTSNVETDNCGN